MKTTNVIREEEIESKLESIRRYMSELRTRTNAHLQKIQDMVDETLLQTRTNPPTIEINNALEDSEINDTKIGELVQEKEGNAFRHDGIDPRTMIEVIDELECEGKSHEERRVSNEIKIEQCLDWEVQCTETIEEHRGST